MQTPEQLLKAIREPNISRYKYQELLVSLSDLDDEAYWEYDEIRQEVLKILEKC